MSSNSVAATETNSSSGDSSITFPTNRIFIGNLANELEEFTIYKYCSAYGEITKCQIMKEPKTERNRGFGFITYAQSSSTQAILNARPHYIGHHKINVKPSFPTSEALVQGIALQPLPSHLPRTRRLFVAYNTAEADQNNLAEPAIFGFLSTFGVVKEIVQQFSSASTAGEGKRISAPVNNNNYWIVEFLDEPTVDRCMAQGAIQYFSGVRLHLKRVVSEQDILRRKRRLQEEEAIRQMTQPEPANPTAPANNSAYFPPMRSILSSASSYRHYPTPSHHQQYPARPNNNYNFRPDYSNNNGKPAPPAPLSVPIPPPPPPAKKIHIQMLPSYLKRQKAELSTPLPPAEDILQLKGYGYQLAETAAAQNGGSNIDETAMVGNKQRNIGRDESWR